MVAGNPKLTVGTVNDEGDKIMAQVTTVEGSLVEQFEVDKNTGVWTPVR